MNPTSTSSSEQGREVTGKPAQVLAKFKPEAARDIPTVPFSWWRWMMVPVAIVLAEIGFRIVIDLQIVERPFIYGNYHIDAKVDWFRNVFVPANEPGERYLIMGSSMPNTNMDPARISRAMEEVTGRPWTGFNGAFYAGRYEDMMFFLDWYYDRWEFDHLIMTIEPWGMRPGRFEQLQERLGKPAFERWLMENSALMAIRNQWNLYDTERDTRRRGLEKLDSNSTIYGWARTIPHFAADDLEARARSQADDLLDWRQNPPRPYRNEDMAYDRIPEVQRWAAERGVTIWWVISPMAPPTEKYMFPQFRYESLRALAEEITAVPGNYLLDLKHLEGTLIRDEHWWDANHMLPHGAAIFSAYFGELWGRHYEEIIARGLVDPNPRE